jgi:hypothetical protein
MSESPPTSLSLYRGYVVYFYNAEELVEPVKTPSGSFLWQSLQRLTEALDAAVADVAARRSGDLLLPKDIGGYVETVTVQLGAQLASS